MWTSLYIFIVFILFTVSSYWKGYQLTWLNRCDLLVFAQQLTWLKKKTCWHLHPSWELSYFCPDIVSDPHIHIYNVQWIWKFTYMRFMAFNTYMSTEIYFILYLRVLLTVITLYLSVWWCVKWLGIGYTL